MVDNKVVMIGTLMAVMFLIFGGIVYTGFTLSAGQQPAKVPVKEYRVFGHDEQMYSVYTNQGIFLFQTKDEWDGLELNHTYTCDEVYSGVSLANCTDIRINNKKA
jgi:acyl CoA:acetate/3-ketoacid CoA transferase beta subunit